MNKMRKVLILLDHQGILVRPYVHDGSEKDEVSARKWVLCAPTPYTTIDDDVLREVSGPRTFFSLNRSLTLKGVGAVKLSNLLVFSGFLLLASAVRAQSATQSGTPPTAVPGEVLVKFQPSVTAAQQGLINAELGAEVLSVIPGLGVQRVRSTQGDSADTLIAKFSANPFIQYAEPNSLYYLQTTPNDPRYNCQWGMNNWGAQSGTVGADVDAQEAWSVTTGTGVVVAVIDTGVDSTNTDLSPNLVTGHNFVSGEDPNSPTDISGHGTHVAGTIGAVGNNSIAVAGMNWHAKIMPLKISDSPIVGTSVDIAASAVTYAISNGAKLINASFIGPYSMTLDAAIQQANTAGILFVAAAGNASTQITSSNASSNFPCTSTQSNVICVAATDRTDHLANYNSPDPGPVPSGCPTPPANCGSPCQPGSNYGTGYVHLAAPGKEITSTTLTSAGSYATKNGTSTSAPHVTGTAALLLSYNSSLTVAQLKAAILNHVDLVPALAGKVTTNGRLNAFAALQSLESLPTAYAGYADGVNCAHIAGWAWDANHESTRVNVDIYDGATKIATVTANAFRSDLLTNGIGDGYHAFTLQPIPTSLNDGRTHTISVKFAGTSTNLNLSPTSLICQVSMFTTQTPTETDTASNYEDGTQFVSTLSGGIVGLRYWRAAGETGTHYGKLWNDSTGQLIAQLTFTGDTGSGWIATMFSTAINITANTKYRVSYNQNTQNVKIACGLNPPITNGPLTAQQGGYSTPSGTFPGPPNGTNTCSNLFADVIFSQ